jgi:hypothetical protein
VALLVVGTAAVAGGLAIGGGDEGHGCGLATARSGGELPGSGLAGVGRRRLHCRQARTTAAGSSGATAVRHVRIAQA